MSILRYRMTDESKAKVHPEGEIVQYVSHAAEVARLRDLMDKTSRDNMALRSQIKSLSAAADRITVLEAEVKRLLSERDELRGALDATTSMLDRCAKRLPDPAHLRVVLSLAEGLGAHGMPTRKERKALNNVRATLEGATP